VAAHSPARHRTEDRTAFPQSPPLPHPIERPRSVKRNLRASFRGCQAENPDGLQAILAVPLFHPAEYSQEMRSSWGTIGVVCSSSSSPACKIPRLLNEILSDEEQETMNLLYGLAEVFVGRMFASQCSHCSAPKICPTRHKTEVLD